MTLQEATVTNVEDRDGIILLRVQFSDGETAYPVAFGKSGSSFVISPKEGDVVAIQETDNNRYVATTIISRSTVNTRSVDEGEFAFQLDSDNVIYATKTANGFKLNFEMTDEVTIDAEKVNFI